MNAEQSTDHVWRDSFDEETRAEQRQDDSDAWHAVTGLLLTIITIGVTLAAVTVVICTTYGN